MSKYNELWSYIKNSREDTLVLTFEEIGTIGGVELDHSFLQYKKELTQYGYRVKKISMKEKKVMFEKL